MHKTHDFMHFYGNIRGALSLEYYKIPISSFGVFCEIVPCNNIYSSDQRVDECHLNSYAHTNTEDIVNTDSDSVGWGWGLRLCISNQF
jgi:hypothetical protein